MYKQQELDTRKGELERKEDWYQRASALLENILGAKLHWSEDQGMLAVQSHFEDGTSTEVHIFVDPKDATVSDVKVLSISLEITLNVVDVRRLPGGRFACCCSRERRSRLDGSSTGRSIRLLLEPPQGIGRTAKEVSLYSSTWTDHIVASVSRTMPLRLPMS